MFEYRAVIMSLNGKEQAAIVTNPLNPLASSTDGLVCIIRRRSRWESKEGCFKRACILASMLNSN